MRGKVILEPVCYDFIHVISDIPWVCESQSIFH